MTKKLSHAQEAWLMNQVISLMNNEGAYYSSGWLYIWPDECSFEECKEYFSEDESFNELKEYYLEVFEEFYGDGFYKIGNEYNHEDILEYIKETLTELDIKGTLKETKKDLWEVVEETVSEIKEEVEKEPTHLKKLLDTLNAPKEYEFDDGDKEFFDSDFNFKMREDDGKLLIYDTNEVYTINYEEDLADIYSQIADEFGVEMKTPRDTIMPQILDAVKKDFGKDAYIEWENNVVMTVVKGTDESLTEELSDAEERELLDKLNKSNVPFTVARDKDGETFLIFDGWEEVKEIQKVIKPDFEPKDKYDSSVLDKLFNWGFYDEWAPCDECGALIRAVPDSYSFTPDYWFNEEKNVLLCGDCVRNNHALEYAKTLINKSDVANTILGEDDLENLGFELIDSGFENGWYDRHDNPKEILETALEKHPEGAFLFSISEQGQFATQFELWGADLEETEEEEETEVEESLLKESSEEYDKWHKEHIDDATDDEVEELTAHLLDLAQNAPEDLTENERRYLATEVVTELEESKGETKKIKETMNEKLSVAEIIANVLDDYGILYDDIIDNGTEVNIAGVDVDEWGEACDAIQTELGYTVLSTEADDDMDEIVVLVEDKSLKEAKKKSGYFVYQFPAILDNYIDELKKLFKEYRVSYLGRENIEVTGREDGKQDIFALGRKEDLEAVADALDYVLHPDYLCPADDFADELVMTEVMNNTKINALKESLKEEKESVSFTKEETAKFAKELTQFLFDSGDYHDVWDTDTKIEAQIEWGDWKHDHLRFERLVRQFFEERDIEVDIEQVVTDKDDSDTYSARYTITKSY